MRLRDKYKLHSLFDKEADHIHGIQEDGLILIYGRICDVGIHRIYYEDVSLTEIMYEHFFSQVPEQITKGMQQPT